MGQKPHTKERNEVMQRSLDDLVAPGSFLIERPFSPVNHAS